MFRRGLKLPFNLFGIPLYLDLSFLLVFPLMVWATSRLLAPEALSGPYAIGLGAICVAGLFVCVVLHELGHSLVARRYGVKVRRITLWFLGGVAEFEDMPQQRGAEAVVAIAGPIVSFLCAAVFFGLALLTPQESFPSLWLISGYLCMVNLSLAIFNLIPAMPMDGGRILRSLLALAMPHHKATTIAGHVARVIAVLFGLLGAGVLGFFTTGALTPNVWLIVLAFFIFTSAGRETEHSLIREMLHGLTAGDLMNRDLRPVPHDLPAGALAAHVLTHRDDAFPVVDPQGRLIGMVGLEQLRGAHPHAPVWQVMAREIPAVHRNTPAIDAMARLMASPFARLIVLDDAGNMIGLLTRADLQRAIQLRAMGHPAHALANPQAGWQPLPPPGSPAAPAPPAGPSPYQPPSPYLGPQAPAPQGWRPAYNRPGYIG